MAKKPTKAARGQRTGFKETSKRKAPGTGADFASMSDEQKRERVRASYQWLVDACEAKFGAILRANAFGNPEVDVDLRDASFREPPLLQVRYRASSAGQTNAKIVGLEADDYSITAWVSFDIAPKRYGLRWFMEELGLPAPTMDAPRGLLQRDEATALLDRYAEFLREHATEVLSADALLLERIRARIARALRA